ncbi:MAG TPA: FtsX-like permease family protein [Kofleriaceae bacterium]|nr:FtsX-like permease family protein [Kofleriaceae bacterium]
MSALLRSKAGALVVATQVALTIAIVCNALFVVDARLDTASRPSGVDEANVFQMRFSGARMIEDRKAMVQADLDALRAIPGVAAVALVNSLPESTSGSYTGLSSTPEKPDAGVNCAMYYSGESMVDALGLRIVEGRDFAPEEIVEVDARTGAPLANHVILSRALARRLFPDAQSYVGKRAYFGTGSDARPLEVVGVVETLMDSSAQLGDDAYLSFIFPVRLLSNGALYAVRTEPGQLSRVMAAADKQLIAMRHDRVRTVLRSMDEIRDQRYRQERAGANMLIAVTVGLLLVTASGIVGVASLWVAQRRKQIGIRRALGARRVDIIKYFVTENLIITTAGIVLGVALAIGLNQYLVSKVELARLPVEYLGGGVVAAWALGLVAVLGPAWRAATVAPATATRSV